VYHPVISSTLSGCCATSDNGSHFTYQTIAGGLLIKPQNGLGFTAAAKAWISHQRRGFWPKVAQVHGGAGFIPRFGLWHWATYGQAEQFLSHWLYYCLAERGLFTAVNLALVGGAWRLDWEYGAASGPCSVWEPLVMC
jgi:hypothetical protein